MSDYQDPEQQGVSSDPEPGLVRITGQITGTSDPEEASRMADMLLLFLTAGGTVSGTFVALGLFFIATDPHLPTAGWITALLATVFLGGMVGCAIVMRLLHAKGMIRWEHKREAGNS